jgi:hypothetical protein
VKNAETKNLDGMYDWIVQGAAKGMTVLEMEMAAWQMAASGDSEVVVCCRDTGFFHHEGFLRLPKIVQERYMDAYVAPSHEGDQTAHLKMKELKQTAKSKANHVIQYSPTFEGFEQHARTAATSDSNGHKVEQESAGLDEKDQDTHGEIRLGGVLELGLSVFEVLSNAITKRYSFSRASVPGNPFVDSSIRQSELISALCKCQCQVPSQEAFVSILQDCGEFLHLNQGCVTLVIGPHGSGKSTLLARLLVELNVLELQKDASLQVHNAGRLSRTVRHVISVNRVTGHTGVKKSEVERISKVEWSEMRSTIRGVSEKNLFENFHRLSTEEHLLLNAKDGDAERSGEAGDLPLPGWLRRSGARTDLMKVRGSMLCS